MWKLYLEPDTPEGRGPPSIDSNSGTHLVSAVGLKPIQACYQNLEPLFTRDVKKKYIIGITRKRKTKHKHSGKDKEDFLLHTEIILFVKKVLSAWTATGQVLDRSWIPGQPLERSGRDRSGILCQNG